MKLKILCRILGHKPGIAVVELGAEVKLSDSATGEYIPVESKLCRRTMCQRCGHAEIEWLEDGDMKGDMELKRAPGTCCPEPGCDNRPCKGCEYLGVCKGDSQKVDYCPLPRTCLSCGADCTKCDLWDYRAVDLDFSKMTEGQALYSLGVRAIEKDGVKGINLPIPGKPGQTLFIRGSDEKPGAIIASDRKQDRVKGAKKTRCADCRGKVWISPSTQVMRKRYPRVPVICLPCFAKRTEAEKKKEKEA